MQCNLTRSFSSATGSLLGQGLLDAVVHLLELLRGVGLAVAPLERVEHLARVGEHDIVVAGALGHGHAVYLDSLAEAGLEVRLQLLELRHSALYGSTAKKT